MDEEIDGLKARGSGKGSFVVIGGGVSDGNRERHRVSEVRLIKLHRIEYVVLKALINFEKYANHSILPDGWTIKNMNQVKF